MPTTYMSYDPRPSDTLWQRMDKLYLGLISTGEELYSRGAQLNEMMKQLDVVEDKMKQFRKEFAELKAEARKRGYASRY